MLELQKFIKDNPKDFREKLAEKPYSIKVTEDEHHILFKYNQIQSDFNLEIVRECRGIILYKEDYSIAAHPFHKFFNVGELQAHDIDWKSSVCLEKLDGSLIKIWFSKAWSLWMVSTNGTIDAHDADINYPNMNNFADLFWYTYEKMEWDNYRTFYEYMNKDRTYLFEICSPANRIVVPHTVFKLYHLATKINETGEEIEEEIGFPKPKRYPLHNLSDCIKASQELPFNDEGYVVVDKDLNRLKIKSPAYVKVHRIRGEGSLTNKRILSIIRENEHQEYLNYYPEDKPYFDDVEEELEKFYDNIVSDLVLLEKKKGFFENRKEAAIWIKDYTTYPAICFALLDGKVDSGNFKEWFKSQSDEKIMSLIGLK